MRRYPVIDGGPSERNARKMAIRSSSLDTVSVTDKEQSFPAAAELAGKGIATVSIDWVAQGERAVKTAISVATTAILTRCEASGFQPRFGMLLPTSTRITRLVARDNARQSALDYMVFIKSRCSQTVVALEDVVGFKVDADNVGYLGISIGGLIGQMTVAMSPEIKALGLSNTGIGWIELLEKDQPLLQLPNR